MSLVNHNADSFHETDRVGFFSKKGTIHPDAEADAEYHRKHSDKDLEKGTAQIQDKDITDEEHQIEKKKPKGMYGAALEFMAKSNKRRFKKAKAHFEEEDERIKDLDTVLLYAASEDLTLVENLSKSTVLEALVRRTAWQTRPMTMLGITLAQLLLCVTAVLSFNEPVNTSTTVMTLIFLVTVAATNPFEVNNDLLALLKKHGGPLYYRKLGPKASIIIFLILSPLLIPIAVVVLTCTITFDLMVGRINDNTFGSLANVIVNCVVISTALSVGIRSGNPISAIQTFAGFEFISRLDEALLMVIKFDPHAEYYIPSRSEAKIKKAYVRAILYTVVPSIVIFTVYITFSNTCFAFCSSRNSFNSNLY